MRGILQALVMLAALTVVLVPAPGTGPRPAGAQPAGGAGELAPLQVIPGAGTFKDPSSGIVFPETVTLRDGDREFRLKAAGSGLRKKVVFKVYGAALYVDETAALGADPTASLAAGDMARRIVMTFKRDVDYGKIREAYEGGLKRVWKGQLDPAVAPDLETFLHYFDKGVKEGQSIELTYLPGKGLCTVVAGTSWPLVTNAKIAHDIWAVWLGDDPVSADLRRDLVRFLTAGEGK
jgi:hypothetical protein